MPRAALPVALCMRALLWFSAGVPLGPHISGIGWLDQLRNLLVAEAVVARLLLHADFSESFCSVCAVLVFRIFEFCTLII